MADTFSYDVFLSHNAKDKPRVRRLAERLKAAGLRVWFDEWNVRSGDIIALKVDEGLEQSRVLLLCVSPNALASGWVALERSTAIHRDPSNEGRRFIPLLLADCDLPDTLRRYKYVDFREEAESAFAELLTACQVEAAEAPPATKPAPTTKKKKSKPVKLSQQREPLAVLERKISNVKADCIAVSPDGKWAACAGSKTTTIFELATGNVRMRGKHKEEHSLYCQAITIVPDGSLVVSADSLASVAHVWSTDPPRKVTTLTGHTSEVWGVATLPNSNVCTGSWDGTMRIWNPVSGDCIKIIEGAGNASLFCLSVDKKGSRIVSGHREGLVRLWSLETSKCLVTFTGHSKEVNSVQITPDGRFAVSASNDKTVKVWDLEADMCVGTLEGNQDRVSSVAISPDGTLIASTGAQAVRLWEMKSGTCLQVIKNEDLWTSSVAFGPDGLRLVVGTSKDTIYVYRLTSVRPAQSVEVTRRYVNAKVVLLGEGTVGKTSLAHRLIEDKYVVRDRTHGMNVWRLDLPLTPDATLEREALLWDLAGQEDYRLIHQLFLEETALALLLVNPQKDDPFAEAGDWLKALKTAAGHPELAREAERLLIFSQTDVGGMKLGNTKIERFREQYGFTDWLSTSAKTGENCSDLENAGEPSKLKQLIAESIPWEQLPWTSTPRLLAELKDAMMAMRDKSDIRLVRFAELSQRMEQALPGEKFGESEVRTAVTLLANNGLARPLKFGDLVLLQPELLNGYAGAIIRAARAHTDEIGCVLEANIYKPGFDFTGVERLKHRPDEELLLRALVQTFLDHSLCIAEDMEQGRQLVFPSQYRREKDIPRDPDIFVSYSFSGEWQTVWTTLVVRLWYSQEFEHRELWRNAAEFVSGKGHTLGLKIDNKQGEGTATISLYFDVQVEDVLKAIFIEFVHRHLAKYGCEVSRDRRYICPNPKCGKPIKDLDAVRKRLDTKKDFIYCQGCDEKVPLIDFIEQRLKSDPVARKIMAMDATATRELDTQALEQILIGHMMAIAGEANQIFRLVAMAKHGIDGEVEFKDNDGKASGKRIYVQLKSENYYLRKWSHRRNADGFEVFDVKEDRLLESWISHPADVYLVIRQMDETSGGQIIRWMNVTRYLKERKDKQSRQILFAGEKLDMEAVWKVRDQFFSLKAQTRK
jgi:WD40 repeat protein